MLLFDDFVSSFSTNSCVKDSITAREIYEQIICNEQIRIAMAEYSDANKPAILISGPAIEEYCEASDHCDLDLTDDTVRRTIGRMNAAALEPLGYTKKRFTPLPKQNPCSNFKSGSVFEKTLPGEEIIVKKIVRLEN